MTTSKKTMIFLYDCAYMIWTSRQLDISSSSVSFRSLISLHSLKIGNCSAENSKKKALYSLRPTIMLVPCHMVRQPHKF